MMKLNINKKYQKKLVKKLSKRLIKLQLEQDDKDDDVLREWIITYDYDKKPFRKVVNVKKGKHSMATCEYINEHVMQAAWDRYWRKIHDRLPQEE